MSTYSDTINADGPVAYFRLDDASGPTAEDVAGCNNNGTYSSSGVTYGQAGALLSDGDPCVLLDGASGRITTPGGCNPAGWCSVSVEAWVRLSTTSFSHLATVWASGTVPTSSDGIKLWIGANGANGGFAVGTTSGCWAQATFSQQFAAGVWYHVAGTWDGSTVRAYVNGVQNGGTGSVGSSVDGTGSNPAIGQDPQKGGDSLPGAVDEAALFSHALSAGAVQRHYAAGIAQVQPPASPPQPVYQPGITSLVTGAPGAVLLLIDDVWYPTIRQDSISIARTASDPIPTFDFVLQDDPSHIAISELAEVVFLDAGQVPDPTHNLLLNPAMNPYATHWQYGGQSGVTPSQQAGGGLALAFVNAASGASVSLAQTTQGGAVTVGQTYMASALVTGSGTPAGVQASLTLTLVSPTGAALSSASFSGPAPPPTGATRYALAVRVPPGVARLTLTLSVAATASSNSGTVTLSQAQLEPVCFPSGPNALAYPTPWCDVSQQNCIPLPDGTTVRQLRLFAGVVSKATAGAYVGPNRQWSVTVSGYAFLLQKQLLNDTWTALSDASIITELVNKYFAGVFSTAQVAGTNSYISSLSYTYNGTARDLLDALASDSNYLYYIDAYRQIWYQPPGYNVLPFELSDVPDAVSSFPYYAYARDVDATQLGNAIYVSGATGVAAIVFDCASIGTYAQQTNSAGVYWRTVADSSIPDTTSAVARGIGEAAQYGYARPILHCATNRFVVPGYTLLFTSRPDGIVHQPYLVQQSTLTLSGFPTLFGASYECQCDLGAFNPDLVQQLSRIRRYQIQVALSANQPQPSTYGPDPPVVPTIGLMATETLNYRDAVAVAITSSTSVPGVPTSWYDTAGAVYGSTLVGYA